MQSLSKINVAAASILAIGTMILAFGLTSGSHAKQAPAAPQAPQGPAAGGRGPGGGGGAARGGGQRGAGGGGAARGPGGGGAPGGGGGARGGVDLGDGPFDIGEGINKVHVVVLTKGLSTPWGMAFLPNGDMLVVERNAKLRLLHKDGKLETDPIAGLPPIRTNNFGGGLLDIALHPKFADNGLVYFAYTKAVADNVATGIFRAKWDGSKLVDAKDVFITGPAFGGSGDSPTRCCGQGPLDASYGARIVFDKEGFLYLANGDRNYGEQAQLTGSDLGKVIRVKDDGSIPADNPFVGKEGYRSEIYTIGHRNPEGMTYDPVTGRIWETEFGPSGGDELNLIEKGKNYGWLLVTNGTHYDAQRAGGPGGGSSGKNNVAGFVDPTVWWGAECTASAPGCGTNGGRSFSPTNVAVYNGDKFPAWKGNVLVGNMGGFAAPGGTGPTFTTFVMRVVVDAKGKMVSQTPIVTGLGQKIRDVRAGPDGFVYVLTDSGAALRVEPGK